MATERSQLGRRYSCFSCACKFYDLNRPDALCPKCGTDQLDDPAPDPRVAAMAASKAAAKAAKEQKAAAEAAKSPRAPKLVKPAVEVEVDESSSSLDNIDEDDELSQDLPS